MVPGKQQANKHLARWIWIPASMLLGMGLVAKEDPVDVKAKILRYEESAAHDQFKDGPCRFYDMTVMEILSPQEYVGQGHLNIFHDGSTGRDSPWRKVGQTYVFTIQRELLEQALNTNSSIFLFSNAVESELRQIVDSQ